MAIKDAVITLKGDQAAVRKIEIMKDDAGNYVIQVYGETKTSDGKSVGLDLARVSRSGGNATLTNMWDLALPILRAANGLE